MNRYGACHKCSSSTAFCTRVKSHGEDFQSFWTCDNPLCREFVIDSTIIYNGRNRSEIYVGRN